MLTSVLILQKYLWITKPLHSVAPTCYKMSLLMLPKHSKLFNFLTAPSCGWIPMNSPSPLLFKGWLFWCWRYISASAGPCCAWEPAPGRFRLVTLMLSLSYGALLVLVTWQNTQAPCTACFGALLVLVTWRNTHRHHVQHVCGTLLVCVDYLIDRLRFLARISHFQVTEYIVIN